MNHIAHTTLILAMGFAPASLLADPVISEFLASNRDGLTDEDGANSDWIEIHNPDDSPVNLEGWSLTDDSSISAQWTFPAVTIPADGRLLVFASGKDRATPGSELHTNFSLNANGEYLALIKPGGSIISSEFDPFPQQKADISYGVSSSAISLVGETSPLKFTLVPPVNDGQGNAWPSNEYDDTAWTDSLTENATFNDSTTVAIADNTTVSSELSATGLSGNVSDIEVTIDISHSYDGDLDIYLVAPNGARVELVTGHGGSGNHFTNTTFDDQASTPITSGVAPFTGTFAPEGALSDLVGTPASGTWQLEVTDQQSGDTGTINSWSITITTSGSSQLTRGAIGYDKSSEYPITTSVPIGTTELWVRYPFQLVAPEALSGLTLSTRHDDGFETYLNGELIHQFNNSAPIQVIGKSSQFTAVDISQHTDKLRAGNNTLAFRLINASATSSDLFLSPRLETSSQAVGYSYSSTPSPGTTNQDHIYDGFVNDTKFSIGRGFFDSAISETVTCSTPGSTIIYTTDGSTPSLSNGTQVPPATDSSPGRATININTTSILRTTAVLDGYLPSNVDTQSYLFPADVVNQSATPAGWPQGSVNGQVLDYGMDSPNQINSSAAEVESALTSIPSISLVTDQTNLLDSNTGIYTHAGNHGIAWERPASVEMIFPNGYTDPDGNLSGFHAPCGIRIRGGFSRSSANAKHSFRLFFRNDYGEKDLDYPLFGTQGASSFKRIDFRTAQNYSWSFNANDGSKNTFIRDVFNRDLQAAMNRPHTRSRYFHLYLNGLYWGLYMTEERPDSHYGDSYLGGSDEDYDVVKSSGSSGGYRTEASNGELSGGDWETAWNLTKAVRDSLATDNSAYFQLQGRNSNGDLNPNLPNYLSVDELIDYMLIIFYVGSADAPLTLSGSASNNWFGMRNRETNSHGFQFFVHDTEHSMDASNRTDVTGPYSAGKSDAINQSNPQFMHEYLANNEEYRIRFADRAHAAFHNAGPLTYTNSIALINARAATMNTAIIAESARWGDQRGGAPYTRSHWLSAVNGAKSWMIGRESTVVNQLRADQLYPDTAPPTFSQHGGIIASGYQLSITNPAGSGTIYLTTDGSDPRAVGGAPAGTSYSGPITLNTATVVKARILNAGEWSPLTEAEFTLGAPPSSSNLVVSEFSYHAAPSSPGGTDGDDFDFIEIMNIGDDNIDLTSLRLEEGVTFDFSAVNVAARTLAPGTRAIVAEDSAAFIARYGASVPLLGQWTGGLKNSGELIRLSNSNGEVIQEFSYNDQLPWPTSADGAGFSLVLINPEANPNHNDPSSWRCSVQHHGSPGSSDRLAAFSGNATDDLDSDGLSALLEHFLGSSDDDPLDGNNRYSYLISEVVNETNTSSHLTIRFTRQLGSDDLTHQVEVSSSLAQNDWRSGDAYVTLVQKDHNNDGTSTEVWRSVAPVTENGKLFIRLRVSQP